MQNSRILYLTHDGLTDPLGQSQILPYLIGLSRQGFSIAIISLEKASRYNQLKQDVIRLCTANSITWMPHRYHTFPPVFATLINLYKVRRSAITTWHQAPFGIVHCRSYLTSLIGVYLKRKFGTRFIFDMRGFWADERKESGIWPDRHFIYSRIYTFFKRREREMLFAADQIVVLTKQAQQEIIRWEVTSTPIEVIPTCVDVAVFNPDKIGIEETSKIRRELGIADDEFVLIYLGSWGSWYCTNEMLTFFDRLRRVRKSIFLILTNDPDQVPNQNGILTRHIHRTQIPTYLTLANAAVFFIQPTFSKKASSATKMGELLAMNVPIVTNRGWGDVEEILGSGDGFLMDGFSNEQMDATIAKLVTHKPNSLQRLKAIDYFNLETGIERYRKIYQSLVNP